MSKLPEQSLRNASSLAIIVFVVTYDYTVVHHVRGYHASIFSLPQMPSRVSENAIEQRAKAKGEADRRSTRREYIASISSD